MDLTSYERVRRYIPGLSSDVLADIANNRRDILQWIPSVSNKIERYLNRETFIQEYTQFFDLKYGSTEFWIENPTISSITSVKYDPTGRFDGTETTLNSTEYFIGSRTSTVVLVSAIPYVGPRVVRIVYSGGMALHGTRSIFAITPSAAWTVGKFVIGDTSQAVGILRVYSASSMTVEVLYGTFIVGETLTEYTSEDASDATGKTATLDSKTQTALCESFPEITAGCEMELRFIMKHKNDFENISTDQDGTTTRHTKEIKRKQPLQQETEAMIGPYRRVAL